MLVFVAAPSEKMAEVINRTRKEAKAKISKVCCNNIIIFNISIALFTIKDQKRFTLLYIKKKQNSKSNYRN